MNDYYEILEVSKKASKEVIEKAYRVLAKKYHPDVQEEKQKKIAEEKMKLIKVIVDTSIKILKGFGNGIATFFKSIFM